MLVLSPDVGAQAAGPEGLCELGRVTNIIVDNRPVFQLETLEEGSPLRWVYRLANALHITTRQSFILREILFGENDCLDPFLLEESGRILRQYPFIANADVVPVEQPDGTYHILINTQDEWTTKFDLGVSIDQGIQLERIELTEENLFGQGILAEGYFARRREQRDAGFLIEQPRLFGTRTDARFGYGRTRVGNFFEQELAYPFVGEVGRFAGREAYSKRDQLYTYATGNPIDVTQVLLPLQEEWLEISFAMRFGRPGRLGLLGIGLSRDRVEFGGFPNDVEVVLDNDFSNTSPGTDQLQTIIASQINASATTRINLMLGLRQIRYIRPARLDTHGEVIDVPLGIDLGLTVGQSIPAFRVGTLKSHDDVFTRLRLFTGHNSGQVFMFVNLEGQGRHSFRDDGWRDLFGTADFYTYLRTGSSSPHTFFLRTSATAGWSVETPFQLTLGGREAVRGFYEDDIPGARRVLFTLEDRIFLNWPSPDVVDFGFTLFADVGRMWAGEVPYGTNSGWRGSAGFG
ncbi:MAG TPA: hypothetical protein DHW54_05200, partial [Gemmatimonadetes bacterium]|nr:hypothetical protein [Gemmatimonadota bacterium]